MRGCQRQIIMLKGTDSQIFDEAYFLLRKDFEGKSRGEAEIIREAQRIVDSNTTRRRRRRFERSPLFPFLFGFLCCALLWLIFTVL